MRRHQRSVNPRVVQLGAALFALALCFVAIDCYNRGIERVWYSDLAMGPDSVRLYTQRLVDTATGISLPDSSQAAQTWLSRGYRLVRRDTLPPDVTELSEVSVVSTAPEVTADLSKAPLAGSTTVPASFGPGVPSVKLVNEAQTWVRGASALAVPFGAWFAAREFGGTSKQYQRCVCPP